MKILAIDQGTTSTRAVLVDGEGGVRTLTSVTHRQFYPHPGWVEHDANELLGAVERCLEAAAEAGPIDAVGLANQGESCLGWDADTGEPVGPVIVWQDDRTSDVTRRLEADGCEAMVRERAGLPLDPYFSASKLGWIVREVPQARRLLEAGRLRLGTTDAFFRERLTGRFATDAATASRTSLMALGETVWDEALCRLFGVPLAALPPIGPTAGALGALRVGGACVPLSASVVDQQAALYGHGCRAAGDGKITVGTGAFALLVTGTRVPERETGALPTVAWQMDGEAPTYALDGGVYAAAAAVNWVRALGLFDGFEEIDAFDGPSAISRGIMFVPALAGLACPHWDRSARGAFVGLSLDTGPRDMVRAVLEGVAMRLVEVIDAMRQAAPLSEPVSIDGGVTRNPYFCRFLASALGASVRVSDVVEVTALGAAAMAARGAGLSLKPPHTGRIVAPRPLDTDVRARFRAAREGTQTLARTLRGP